MLISKIFRTFGSLLVFLSTILAVLNLSRNETIVIYCICFMITIGSLLIIMGFKLTGWLSPSTSSLKKDVKITDENSKIVKENLDRSIGRRTSDLGQRVTLLSIAVAILLWMIQFIDYAAAIGMLPIYISLLLSSFLFSAIGLLLTFIRWSNYAPKITEEDDGIEIDYSDLLNDNWEKRYHDFIQINSTVQITTVFLLCTYLWIFVSLGILMWGRLCF